MFSIDGANIKLSLGLTNTSKNIFSVKLSIRFWGLSDEQKLIPMTKQAAHKNHLIHETSPYLLQHAHNPVNWYPWSDEALAKAKAEDKPLIVSIGYSSCHWCHVMEDESFEDEGVAEIMNNHFVSIKVDREERPDLDELYIDAVSLMTGRAGWPLNVIALPDGRPIFGGTYFPKEQWMEVLNEISRVYREEREKVLDYAKKLENGIQQINLVEPVNDQKEKPPREAIDAVYAQMESNFDTKHGGRETAPKFPLPDNYRFLLRYYNLSRNENALSHVNLSLTQMAKGGIFDQIGGGFHRYSTDEKWKVPHFEKMLYDNGQLLSLYAEAYQVTHDTLYKDIASSIAQFLKREMQSPEGGFYSAIDADSEGAEGKFYIWTETDLDEALAEDHELAKAHFGINEEALWEKGQNVLLVAKTAPELASEFRMQEEDVREKLGKAYQKLFRERAKREGPALDDKCLTSWNSLALKGLEDAYKIFGDSTYHEMAKANINFIKKHLVIDQELYRSYKDGQTKIKAFLEDYAHLIQAYIQYYENTFEESILWEAKGLMEQAIDRFFDESNGMFYSTSKHQEKLITRKIDFSDNVIASDNSAMAYNLFALSHLFNIPDWYEKAQTMVLTIQSQMKKNPEFFSNWAGLHTLMAGNFYEVAITGPNALSQRFALEQAFLPNKVLAGTYAQSSQLPLLKGRLTDQNTLIHVCTNQTCQAPTTEIKEALASLTS